MENFFNKVKTTFNKATDEAGKYSKIAIDEAGKYSKIAIEKTSSIVNSTKLKFAVNEAENKLFSIMAELGEYIYNEYSGGAEFPEEIASKCNDIDTLKEEISSLKKKIAEAKDAQLCNACGSFNDKENVFCSTCGAKLEAPESEEE